MVVGLQRVAEHQVPELQETLVTLLEPQSLMALAVVVVRGVEQLVLVVQLEEAPVVLQVNLRSWCMHLLLSWFHQQRSQRWALRCHHKNYYSNESGLRHHLQPLKT